MEIFTSKADVRSWSRARKRAGERVAFVPTMGYLHEGHLSLVRLASEQGDVVVVSIYVNPTQFGPDEDFDIYPRDTERDVAALRDLGVNAVFMPEDLYVRAGSGEPPHETWVEVEHLQEPLCGASRPGFFRGVATVVTKLFNIVEPDVAVFGRKDHQQWRLISRLVRDLDMGIEIVSAPIAREADGLARSSRNVRLSADDRVAARVVPGSLLHARDLVQAGERDADAIRQAMREHIEGGGGQVDYAQLVDPATLRPVAGRLTGDVVAAVAVQFGDVRLIDNRDIAVPGR